METVTIGGRELGGEFIVTNVSRAVASVSPSLELVGGGGRYVNKGSVMTPPTISFSVIFPDGDPISRRDRVRQLASLLTVGRFVDVAFSSDMGLYYRAMPTNPIDTRETVRSGSSTVVMTCESVAMYGAERSVTVPSGGSVGIYVDGSWPTYPTIRAASAVADQSTGLWGLSFDGVQLVRVEPPTQSPVTVSIDCEEGLCEVAGVASMITLDSDWVELQAGQHTISNNLGTGACVVTWRERWL